MGFEVGSDTFEAHRVHPIVDLPDRYSLVARGSRVTFLQDLPRARNQHHAYGVWRAG